MVAQVLIISSIPYGKHRSNDGAWKQGMTCFKLQKSNQGSHLIFSLKQEVSWLQHDAVFVEFLHYSWCFDLELEDLVNFEFLDNC